MKLDCELIQDLLPLYAEGLCSLASRRAVEEHLPECEHCRRLTAPLPIEEPEDTPNADHAFSISIADTHSIRIAVFFLKVISTNFEFYGMNVFSVSDNNS